MGNLSSADGIIMFLMVISEVCCVLTQLCVYDLRKQMTAFITAS